MEFTEGSSFGYDQVTVGLPKYYNKDDSSLLYRDRSHPDNEVRERLRQEGKKQREISAGESAFQYYLRKNIKDEIEKYEMRKPRYTGKSIETMPQSSGYPLCESEPKRKKEGMVPGGCSACIGHGVIDYKKKYDDMLLIILVVVIVFCITQFSSIQKLRQQISEITATPLRPDTSPA